jgi:hypothetical protein
VNKAPAPRELSAHEMQRVAGGAFPFIQTAMIRPEQAPQLAFPFIQT